MRSLASFNLRLIEGDTMFVHVSFRMRCLIGMYASVAFSDHYAFQHSDKEGRVSPPSPEADLMGFYTLLIGPSSFTSYLGGGLTCPVEFNHSFVFFFFFFEVFDWS